jgi:uncharacterized membrane protein YbaN (DUF454 family)
MRKDIREFGKRKVWLAVPLILVGILGLVLPIIPGIAFILLGVMLLFPKSGEKIKEWFRSLR